MRVSHNSHSRPIETQFKAPSPFIPDKLNVSPQDKVQHLLTDNTLNFDSSGRNGRKVELSIEVRYRSKDGLVQEKKEYRIQENDTFEVNIHRGGEEGRAEKVVAGLQGQKDLFKSQERTPKVMPMHYHSDTKRLTDLFDNLPTPAKASTTTSHSIHPNLRNFPINYSPSQPTRHPVLNRKKSTKDSAPIKISKRQQPATITHYSSVSYGPYHQLSSMNPFQSYASNASSIINKSMQPTAPPIVELRRASFNVGGAVLPQRRIEEVPISQQNVQRKRINVASIDLRAEKQSAEEDKKRKFIKVLSKGYPDRRTQQIHKSQIERKSQSEVKIKAYSFDEKQHRLSIFNSKSIEKVQDHRPQSIKNNIGGKSFVRTINLVLTPSQQLVKKDDLPSSTFALQTSLRKQQYQQKHEQPKTQQQPQPQSHPLHPNHHPYSKPYQLKQRLSQASQQLPLQIIGQHKPLESVSKEPPKVYDSLAKIRTTVSIKVPKFSEGAHSKNGSVIEEERESVIVDRSQKGIGVDEQKALFGDVEKFGNIKVLGNSIEHVVPTHNYSSSGDQQKKFESVQVTKEPNSNLARRLFIDSNEESKFPNTLDQKNTLASNLQQQTTKQNPNSQKTNLNSTPMSVVVLPEVQQSRSLTPKKRSSKSPNRIFGDSKIAHSVHVSKICKSKATNCPKECVFSSIEQIKDQPIKQKSQMLVINIPKHIVEGWMR